MRQTQIYCCGLSGTIGRVKSQLVKGSRSLDLNSNEPAEPVVAALFPKWTRKLLNSEKRRNVHAYRGSWLALILHKVKFQNSSVMSLCQKDVHLRSKKWQKAIRHRPNNFQDSQSCHAFVVFTAVQSGYHRELKTGQFKYLQLVREPRSRALRFKTDQGSTSRTPKRKCFTITGDMERSSPRRCSPMETRKRSIILLIKFSRRIYFN